MSDLLTELSRAVAGVASVARPYVERAVRQKYEEDYRERLRDWGRLVAMGKPDAVHRFVVGLCHEAGQTVGSMGENISVPVGILSALIEVAAEKVKQDALLNHLQFK